MIDVAGPAAAFPKPLTEYPATAGQSLGQILSARIDVEPFNAIVTGIFVLAILHTFTAARFTAWAHRVQERHEHAAHWKRPGAGPSILAGLLHFLGEVEVVFGLWAVVLFAAICAYAGWSTATHYLNDTVNYTEPLFVVVIMALASTRPIVHFAESQVRRIAGVAGGTPAAWWVTILILGPLLGSFITEPGAMTISAMLLARQFYDLKPTASLKYATLGLLFVNVSIGGTLTHFAAPPVLMVARPWGWDTAFMLAQFGWRAVAAIALSTAVYYLWFRAEFTALAARPSERDVEQPDEATGDEALLPLPAWVIAAHIAFIAWTVINAHYPALFLGGFLFYLGFAKATAAYQSRLELRAPLLVGFFLAGLVIHGGVQAWWIAPTLASLAETPLFLGATLLTAFNDNALITYLSTLVPNLPESFKIAVVQGAVTGGGLTVIANAPNPAGQAVLSRFFDGSVSPLRLAIGALVPTIIAAIFFRF
jgi:hypothetical protein